MLNEEQMEKTELGSLLKGGDFLDVPKLGDLIKGKVISTKGREVRLDLNGLTTGIVRGRELFVESSVYSDLKVGDEVESTVIDLENENGEMELSFRYAGNKKSWEELRNKFNTEETIKVRVLDANKGGLLVKSEHVTGFLPVSQLAPEHYPRVSGGDKQKILDKLKEYVGQTFTVKILDINEKDEKLIVSEKTVWENEQKSVISQISVGNVIEGEVTALADFGAFIKFFPSGEAEAPLEGLVHISEIAWQRIDHPKDLIKVGQKVKAQIIGIEGSKIFLSMKKLIEDPWQDVASKYKIGETVEGKILKINPFGFFVELDEDIHGLAHVSELSSKPLDDVTELGKIGETREFKIVSIEADKHRLGLSIKALEKGANNDSSEEKNKTKEEKSEKNVKKDEKENGESTENQESENDKDNKSETVKDKTEEKDTE